VRRPPRVLLALPLLSFLCSAVARAADFDAAVSQASVSLRKDFDQAAAKKAAAKKPARSPATLRYEPLCILRAVARQMNVKLRAEVPLPSVHFESRTDLRSFQDAVEPQWGQRPPQVMNVFVVARNEVYLIDDASYYERMKRAIDDSLAHEFVHYLQVRYKGYTERDLGEDFGAEAIAIEHQTWFRENYIQQPGICPAE
jgi:hypothetical protein